MTSRILFLLLTLGGAIFANAQGTSRMREFKIAGGQTVKCAVSDAGPLPAQNGPYKMEVSGMMLKQDESGKHISLIFTFGLKISTADLPSRVVVEDVSGGMALTMIDDKSPTFENNYWKGDAAPLAVSRTSTPWVFDNQPTVKVFKITISVKGGKAAILYQPSWYAVSTKAQIVQLIKNNG